MRARYLLMSRSKPVKAGSTVEPNNFCWIQRPAFPSVAMPSGGHSTYDCISPSVIRHLGYRALITLLSSRPLNETRVHSVPGLDSQNDFNIANHSRVLSLPESDLPNLRTLNLLQLNAGCSPRLVPKLLRIEAKAGGDP